MKLLRKLRNAWVILLIIFSMLLSGCGQTSAPPDDNGNNEIEDGDNNNGSKENEEKPFDPAELSEYINYGYYMNRQAFSEEVRSELIAWKTKRVVTDINDITITLSFGFTITGNYDLNDPESYQSYLDHNIFFKNASIYLVNSSADLKILYRTTDEYFTSAKYVCDKIYTSDKIEYKFNHEEEIKLPAELFPGERGSVGLWLVADSNYHGYHEQYLDGQPFLANVINYKKLSDGRIILLTDMERSACFDWWISTDR